MYKINNNYIYSKT